MADTHDGVVDAVGGLIKTAWDAGAATIAGGSPALVFEWLNRTGRGGERADTESWARVTVRHDEGRGASLGGRSSKRFRRGGYVWVQVFVPFTDGSRPPKAIELARLVLGAIQDKRSGGLVLSQAKLEEKGQDKSWYRVDVMSRFTWFERRPT